MRTPSTRRTALGVHRIGRVGLASLAPAVGALLLASGVGGGSAEAKTPGKTYCFYGKCHRVRTIAETQRLVGTEETVMASHYDSCKRDRYNPCGLTSSGEKFNPEAADNAASPVYPDGTTLLVWSPDTRASIVLRVNNAGPYWGNRRLDVSRKAAEVLGFAKRGVAKLKIRVIGAPTVEEARYKRNRTYDPVPGYIGEFASLDDAQTAAATAYMVAGLPSPLPAPTVLGLGNPTQVAGAAGTQSGAALVVPTVLAAAETVPSEEAEPVAATPAVVAPVKVAGFAAVAEAVKAEAKVVERVAVVAAVADPETPSVRKRSHVERTAKRNSRSYRVAARQKKQKHVAKRTPRTVAVAVREKPANRTLTRDSTNDMSVFSRHVHAGMERFAVQEPPRRRPAYSSLRRDRDEG